MNIALAGDDPQLLDWSRRLIALGHSVTFLDAPVEWTLPESQAATDVSTLNAVVAGGRSSAAMDSAARLAMRLPSLILPSAQQAAQLAYRLVLDAEEAGPIIPAFLGRYEPAVQELLRRFIAGELGDLQLLRMERTIVPADVATPSGDSPEGVNPQRLSQSDIDGAFFLDVDLLRLLGGDFNRVTTMLVGAQDGPATQAMVTLGSDANHEATWTLTPGGRAEWRLTMTGSRAIATLAGTEDGTIGLTLGGQDIPFVQHDVVDRCLNDFLQRIKTEPLTDSDQPSFVPAWNDYVRSYDLLEATHRSVRRRRTIDLHLESASERNQFKSQMATIGCGVLMWTFFGTLGGLTLGTFLDPRDALERRAAAAGTILWSEDFPIGEAQPAPEALARVMREVERDQAESIVLIEALGTATAAVPLDVARRDAVLHALQTSIATDTPPQTDVRPLAGRGFRKVMLVLWTIVYAPLGVYLLLQLLISLTRGHQPSR